MGQDMAGEQLVMGELTPTVTARQAPGMTEAGSEWWVHRMGPRRYWIGCMSPDGDCYWVRSVNGEKPVRFASLDTAAAWIRNHAKAGNFFVLETQK